MLSFFGSGAIHVASEMAMHPVGYPSGLMIFFLLAGVGCALEATLKQFTGHRVSGVLGQVWTWGYMAVIGKWVTWGWLAAGYGGCWVTPGGGPGDYIAHLLVKYVIAQGPQ
jgi:hypothetical protein